jgi:GT2 family glycosyltransferase
MTQLSPTGIRFRGDITSESKRPKLSIVLLTYARDDAIEDLLAHIRPMVADRRDVEIVLVDNNGDGQDRSGMLAGFPRVRFCATEKNLGAALGRNRGIEIATGEYLLFIDDDALICPADFVDRVLGLFQRFPKAGILAFKSLSFYTNELIASEFPHTDKRLSPDRPFKTFRFIGVGNAVRRDVFEKVGLYRAEFFYGGEEFDLAYRTIKAGYEIWYTPEIWVLHKHNPKERLPSISAIERNYGNKLKVGFLHLPRHVRLINMAAWTVFSIWRSRGRLSCRRVFRDFHAWVSQNRGARQPLGREARAYIRSCGGAIWR